MTPSSPFDDRTDARSCRRGFQREAPARGNEDLSELQVPLKMRHGEKDGSGKSGSGMVTVPALLLLPLHKHAGARLKRVNNSARNWVFDVPTPLSSSPFIG